MVGSERGELEKLLEQSQAAQPPSGDTASEPAPGTADAPASPALSAELLDAELAKISNLLDTLPASLQLLDKKWSEARCEKVASQLKSVKEILGSTSAQASTQAGWQNRLSEYNGLARDFKRIRDLPRSMNG